jgi:hypothetical protein
MPTPYQSARLLIRDGDVCAMANGGIVGLVGHWTHVGVAIWLKNVLMLAEVREWHGGRLVTLSSQVTRYPGKISVFRPACERNVARYAAELVARKAGADYGWRSIQTAIVKRLLFGGRKARWACRDTTPSKFGAKMHCSQTLAWAFRQSAKDAGSLYFPCEGVSDKCVEPTPLIESVDSRGVLHFELAFEGLTHRSAMR